jgi:hypothetical protein
LIQFMAKLRDLLAGSAALALLLALLIVTAGPSRAVADGGKEGDRHTGGALDALHRMDDDDGDIGINHEGTGGGPDGNGGPKGAGDDTPGGGGASVSAQGGASVSADGTASVSADGSANDSLGAFEQPPQAPGENQQPESQQPPADRQSRVLGAQASPAAGTLGPAAGGLPAAGLHGSSGTGVNGWAFGGGLSLAGIAAGLAALAARLRRRA